LAVKVVAVVILLLKEISVGETINGFVLQLANVYPGLGIAVTVTGLPLK